MLPRGVLVRGPQDTSCSGVLLEQQWVLSHGTALGSKILKRLADDLQIQGDDDFDQGRLHVPSAARRSSLSVVLQPPSDGSPTVSSAPAILAGLWRCPLLAEAASNILSRWTFCDDKFEERLDERLVRWALPIFVVLRITSRLETTQDPQKTLLEARGVLERLRARVAGARWPARGSPLLVESCPFGAPAFLGACSRGVASATAGPRRCLVLADARAGPAGEGAPVFHTPGHNAPPDREHGPVGLLVASLSWWRGEWLGFTLAVALAPVLEMLLRSPSRGQASALTYVPRLRDSSLAEKVDAAVVLVRCGPDWGSGVALAEAPRKTQAVVLVVTCAHVVHKADVHGVRVWWRGKYQAARVLYRTRAKKQYDVAVLSIAPQKGLEGLPLASKPALKGEPVIAAGFPLMSEHDNSTVQALVTEGHVATASSAMLHTTCCVQSGASGGAVLRPSGELLALLVCNLRDDHTGALYPRFSLCIPAAVLSGPLQKYCQSEDISSLEELECTNPAVERLWALQIPVISKL